MSIARCSNKRNTAVTYVVAHCTQYLAVMRLLLTHLSLDLGFEALEMWERHLQFRSAVSFAGPLVSSSQSFAYTTDIFIANSQPVMEPNTRGQENPGRS